MEITYWSDFACPFCYIGSTRLKRALKDLGMEGTKLEFKSFQLDPEAPEETKDKYLNHFTHGIKELEPRAKKQMTNIANMAKEEGLEFNIFDVVPVNTMSAHRLFKLAENKYSADVADNLIHRFYHIYFVEGKSIADNQVLKAAALASGLSETDIDEVLTSDKFEDEVLEDRKELEAFGVNGVPFFVINNKYAISGAQPYDVFINALKKISAEES
ncbi:putative DsbA family dithiol-disulfide isomerase [Lactobacillus colini]|uniref:DsbA family dithiol-disulfide isomerase n=1 Tax=Lactobacillus colini TaxID=1819254 RepID=A0ABS4MFC9_9LACO|nr:DsbA family oxidoreductase [Lactobacillus colini]MBP2058391.1 putative DsbA family dithiol-disulfide isomerase [Lactobacillus colini]